LAKTILVVDDEIQIREIITEFLQTYNFDVLEAANGEEALKEFSKCKVELVITDIRMPVMNGLQLLRAVKQNPPKTPVILMTGYQPTKSQELAMTTKADGYLMKPFSLLNLRDSIQKILPDTKFTT